MPARCAAMRASSPDASHSRRTPRRTKCWARASSPSRSTRASDREPQQGIVALGGRQPGANGGVLFRHLRAIALQGLSRRRGNPVRLARRRPGDRACRRGRRHLAGDHRRKRRKKPGAPPASWPIRSPRPNCWTTPSRPNACSTACSMARAWRSTARALELRLPLLARPPRRYSGRLSRGRSRSYVGRG